MKLLPVYTPIETSTLLSDIILIREALDNLSADDNASFSSPLGNSTYNPRLAISELLVRELLTRETLVTESIRIIKVKKPDYLGASKWSFKYSDHLIEAKILDDTWLKKFQNREIDLQPGDSLRVLLKEKISYGYDNEIVHSEYDVINVYEVIKMLKLVQGNLLDSE